MLPSLLIIQLNRIRFQPRGSDRDLRVGPRIRRDRTLRKKKKKQIMNQELKIKVGKNMAWEQSLRWSREIKHSDAARQKVVEKADLGEKKMKDYHRPMRWRVRCTFKCFFFRLIFLSWLFRSRNFKDSRFCVRIQQETYYANFQVCNLGLKKLFFSSFLVSVVPRQCLPPFETLLSL